MATGDIEVSAAYQRLLDRYRAETGDYDYRLTARKLVLEAKLLLVCEDLRRRAKQSERLDDLLPLVAPISDDLISADELLETIRERLFMPQQHVRRRQKVIRIYDQISRADADRIIIRPAKRRRRTK